MASPRTCISKHSGPAAGITLLEILIVLGLSTVICGFALLASFESLRGYGFRNERDMLIAILQKARSQAVSNLCSGSDCRNGQPHGVNIQPGRYILFQGADYAHRDQPMDEIITANYDLTVSGILEVAFSRLSGDAAPASVGDIIISDPAGHSSVVSINSEGGITWTN